LAQNDLPSLASAPASFAPTPNALPIALQIPASVVVHGAKNSARIVINADILMSLFFLVNSLSLNAHAKSKILAKISFSLASSRIKTMTVKRFGGGLARGNDDFLSIAMGHHGQSMR